MRPRVVITNWVHDEVLRRLATTCDVCGNDTREALPAEEVLRRARDADALMVFMNDRVDRAFLESCPRLKVVAGALKGYDNLDAAACTERGVWLTVVPDLLTAPTAELAVGLLLAVGRNILAGDRLVRSGGFSGWRPVLYGAGLQGRVVGLFGLGAVGQAIAQRLAGFDTRLVYHDPRRLAADEESRLNLSWVSFSELLRASDYLVSAAPLTPDTLHAFNAGTISRMKQGAYLVNVGRGSVVDEEAVAAALASGHLAGYAADVYEMEDLSRSDRPHGVAAGILSEGQRTVLTPHLGTAVEEVRLRIALEAAENILCVLRGEVPPGRVNDPRR
jgi:phosphonate dehydrogenase